jgi:hypothetical protein
VPSIQLVPASKIICFDGNYSTVQETNFQFLDLFYRLRSCGTCQPR